ncbi:MAG: DoxX family protein [Parachlamydiales bacterium]|nr:DoxX family protein [Parachlamydiales bacterium]
MRITPYTRGQNAAILIGRVLISLIFLVVGIYKVTHWHEMTDYLDAVKIPMPYASLLLATIIELLGGLMLLLGYKARFGAFVLLIFLIPTTFIFHSYWNVHSAAYSTQMMMFWKNMAIAGGLFILLGTGAGSWALDN